MKEKTYIPLRAPFTEGVAEGLKAGDWVAISGYIYTARDAAHQKMKEALERGETLPFDLKGAVIYYAGPTPARPGQAVGSLGPTTSGRMDAFAPLLLQQGVKAMIGKGPRSQSVAKAIVQAGAVYLAALGGAGALLSRHVVKREVIAYPALESEAVARLEVKDFPALVALDAKGRDYYQLGPALYAAQQGVMYSK